MLVAERYGLFVEKMSVLSIAFISKCKQDLCLVSIWKKEHTTKRNSSSGQHVGCSGQWLQCNNSNYYNNISCHVT